jgi:diaminohydroxyphosphoribosylaminopyrimidine deaminase/5-amino-6-(5-phosphoribosylamino)uracil reductase
MKYQKGEKLEKVQAEALAIEVALLGGNRVSSNPMVGCVILDKDSRLLSTGHHEKYGEGHAEVNALSGLSMEQLEGAQVFVTLEPCAHHGKTPPCADLLIQFPIAKLVYGKKDPHPLVSGKGLEKIRQHGIVIEEFSPENKNALEESLELFFFLLKNKRTYFALKTAISKDEKIADVHGNSKWITNETSRKHVHALRARYQGILVGKQTLVRDDPWLNIRHEDYPSFENTVIVLDAEGDSVNILPKLQVLKLRKPEQIIICVDEKHLPRIDAELVEDTYYRHKPTGVGILVIEMNKKDEFSLEDLAQKLYELEIFSVFIEGGARTYESFLNAKLADHIYMFQAEKLLGEDGITWNSKGNAALKKFTLIDERNIESDIYTSYRRS